MDYFKKSLLLAIGLLISTPQPAVAMWSILQQLSPTNQIKNISALIGQKEMELNKLREINNAPEGIVSQIAALKIELGELRTTRSNLQTMVSAGSGLVGTVGAAIGTTVQNAEIAEGVTVKQALSTVYNVAVPVYTAAGTTAVSTFGKEWEETADRHANDDMQENARRLVRLVSSGGLERIKNATNDTFKDQSASVVEAADVAEQYTKLLEGLQKELGLAQSAGQQAWIDSCTQRITEWTQKRDKNVQEAKEQRARTVRGIEQAAGNAVNTIDGILKANGMTTISERMKSFVAFAQTNAEQISRFTEKSNKSSSQEVKDQCSDKIVQLQKEREQKLALLSGEERTAFEQLSEQQQSASLAHLGGCQIGDQYVNNNNNGSSSGSLQQLIQQNATLAAEKDAALKRTSSLTDGSTDLPDQID